VNIKFLETSSPAVTMCAVQPALTLKHLRFSALYLCVSYDSHNKQRLFP